MSDMQNALASAGLASESTAKITPANPSKSAMAKVTNKLPPPTECHYCHGTVRLVHNKEIYGRTFGDWPWAYKCGDCDAHVGIHQFTNIPLGTLANPQLRAARKMTKEVFNPLWQGRRRAMSRTQAYAWLAEQLCIPVGDCHIGWFDVTTCQRAMRAIHARFVQLTAQKGSK